MAPRTRSVELTGGSYESRALSIAAQRCLNLVPEAVPVAQGEPTRMVDVPTNGLSLLDTAPATPIRGMYYAANGNCYIVAGNNLYYLSAGGGALTLLCAVAGAASTSRVTMADNGVTLLIANGTATLTYLTFATGVNGGIVHPQGVGHYAYQVAYVDTFFIIDDFNTGTGLHTSIFWVSDSASTTFNVLSFAAMATRADQLLAIRVVHRNVWLIGSTNTEIWYNSGGGGGSNSFPFAIQPGAFIEYGTPNADTVATINNAVFWLSRQREGQLAVMRGSGLDATRISTSPLEEHLQRSALSGLNPANSYAFTYELAGHMFYVLNFIALNETWAWDDATGLWHERAWLDPADDTLKIARPAFASTYLGNVICGDRANGKIYYLSLSGYTDAGDPIRHIRTFPHLQSDLRRVVYNSFMADIQSGTLLGDTDILLDWSDDGGQTWGNAVATTLGALGATLTQPTWRRLGYSRSRVFRLTWDANGPTALSGAVVTFTEAAT